MCILRCLLKRSSQLNVDLALSEEYHDTVTACKRTIQYTSDGQETRIEWQIDKLKVTDRKRIDERKMTWMGVLILRLTADYHHEAHLHLLHKCHPAVLLISTCFPNFTTSDEQPGSNIKSRAIELLYRRSRTAAQTAAKGYQDRLLKEQREMTSYTSVTQVNCQ
jgi:hypothetical protein